jgi:hypothetical protein
LSPRARLTAPSRCFKLKERGQLFIGAHNETLSVARITLESFLIARRQNDTAPRAFFILNRGQRTPPYPVDGVEAAFILVAFRRFAQFQDNERQRTHSGNEKTDGYDHD